jgi:hypothetical protein
VIKRAVATLSVLMACAAVPAGAAAAELWRDPGRPPLVRADELLGALSFDQKVDIAMGEFGSVAGLGVAALSVSDGPNGVRADGTTSWPSAQTLAATFDRRLARAYGRRSPPSCAGRASTPGSGRRWTSRARRSPAASPKTSARIRF